MSGIRLVIALALLAALRTLAPAADLQILTHGKSLKLTGAQNPAKAQGIIRFGRDAALEHAPDPTCPASTTLELGLFTAATNGVQRSGTITLDCARWTRVRGGWRYRDPDTTNGVAAATYGPHGLGLRIVGPSALPTAGPVGYAFAWFTVGDTRFHGRFHLFRQNDANTIVSRKPSRRAADGESAFWHIVWGDDASDATVDATRATLARAVRQSKADGRSRFLLGMLELYRFGRRTEHITQPDATAREALEAAVAALGEAEPLLWDRATRTGDSRIPGFVGAARYTLAVVRGDEALRQQALADLDYAIDINAFFNVFDLMAVTQAELPTSPAFQKAYTTLKTYLADPMTLACAETQPETCTEAGLAPTALPGTFVVFGDFEAKAGNADAARSWYQFAAAFEPGWPFAGMAANRLATVDARVAAYGDADTANDPPIIGAGAEACASCHNRRTAP